MRISTHLKLGILFPLTRLDEGSLDNVFAERDKCSSPVSKLL